MTRLAILAWNALVRFSDLPGHWWLPLAGAAFVLTGLFWLIAKILDWLEDRSAARDEQAETAFRRAQLDVAARIGRRRA
jgi:hypothetical protein